MDDSIAERDPGPHWRNLDDVSPMIWKRNAEYRRLNIAPHARADLTLLWAMNANSDPLVFWLLLRIYADPRLLKELREEIAPHVQVQSPSPQFGIPEPPRVKIDSKALSSECPLLKACFIESLRLDTTPASLKTVKKDFLVNYDPNSREPKRTASASLHESSAKPYLLRAGTSVLVPFSLHFTDPAYWPDPDIFEPRRHIVQADEKSNNEGVEDTGTSGQRRAEFGTLRPFGGGRSLCPGRSYAEKEVLAGVSAILLLWNIEPVDKRGWRIPRHVQSTGVAAPGENVRVRITRRK